VVWTAVVWTTVVWAAWCESGIHYMVQGIKVVVTQRVKTMVVTQRVEWVVAQRVEWVLVVMEGVSQWTAWTLVVMAMASSAVAIGSVAQIRCSCNRREAFLLASIDRNHCQDGSKQQYFFHV
jgi:hypothetical protein